MELKTSSETETILSSKLPNTITFDEIAQRFYSIPELERGYYQGLIDTLCWTVGVDKVRIRDAESGPHNYILSYFKGSSEEDYQELLFDAEKFEIVWCYLDSDGRIMYYQLSEIERTYEDLPRYLHDSLHNSSN